MEKLDIPRIEALPGQLDLARRFGGQVAVEELAQVIALPEVNRVYSEPPEAA